MALLSFFAIGVVEMFIVALWTKLVSDSRVTASAVVTFVNTVMYFYVLEALLSHVDNTPVIISYALGCAVGTVAASHPAFLKKKTKRVSRSKKAIHTHDSPSRGREQFSPINNEPELVV